MQNLKKIFPYLENYLLFLESVAPPCYLYDTSSPGFMSDVEQTGTEIRNISNDHLLVGDCVGHV